VRHHAYFAGFVFGAATILGCGGGSSGSSGGTGGTRPPVAPAPTCSSAVLPQKAQKTIVPGSGSPDILVPESSIERLADAGVRFHTNQLIFLGGRSSRQGGSSGLTPSQVVGAYGATASSTGGAGAIAIVDAYDYPTALNDFNVFASMFGLPLEPSSDVTASTNAVLQVVYAGGQQPNSDGSWSQEMAIDIEWSHAMAPQAKLYLVEAASSGMDDIMSAVNVAKGLPGVREVTTSFGSQETGCSYVDYDGNFVQPGVAFFASAGDSPGARDYPALSSNAVSVGGTTLTVSAIGTWVAESAWNQTGCGPSSYEPRPVFQDSVYSSVGLYRASCDIAAVADPNTGVSAYDSFPFEGTSGWIVAGGTSVSCPIVAGIVNSSGATFSSSQDLCSTLYAAAGSGYFHQITTGSSGGFLAGSPWSFPTGLGSPNGLAALLAGARHPARATGALGLTSQKRPD
jgi:kumamolisin